MDFPKEKCAMEEALDRLASNDRVRIGSEDTDAFLAKLLFGMSLFLALPMAFLILLAFVFGGQPAPFHIGIAVMGLLLPILVFSYARRPRRSWFSQILWAICTLYWGWLALSFTLDLLNYNYDPSNERELSDIDWRPVGCVLLLFPLSAFIFSATLCGRQIVSWWRDMFG